jgi:hypothetical protein
MSGHEGHAMISRPDAEFQRKGLGLTPLGAICYWFAVFEAVRPSDIRQLGICESFAYEPTADGSISRFPEGF